MTIICRSLLLAGAAFILGGARVAASSLFAHRQFGGIDHPVNVVLKRLDAMDAAKEHARSQSGASQSPTGMDAPAVNASWWHGAVVDHFGGLATAPALWSQRFYIDDRFWAGSGSPVFLYIGGEGPQGPPSPRLFYWTLAQKHGALMVSLEHRFYGASHPTDDLSLASLRLLSSEQALADLETFISYLKGWSPGDDPFMTTPPLALAAGLGGSAAHWVSFGGSYPGNLATWLKLTNPSIVKGTVGSSAPVFSIYDFAQYAQVVGSALNATEVGGSAACFASVALATATLEAKVTGTSPPGSDPSLPKALTPCGGQIGGATATTATALADLMTYEATIFGNFQGVVQYNLESSGVHVSDLCGIMAPGGAPQTSPARALEALANVTALFPYNPELCVPSSFQKDFVKAFQLDDSHAWNSSNRQWTYQSCNEFGYFQTTAPTAGDPATNLGPSNALTSPFSSFRAINATTAGALVCEASFNLTKGSYKGPAAVASEGDLEANVRYGARVVEGLNITMPNGSLDPWHALGVVNASDPFFASGSPQYTIPKGVTIVELVGTAHCRDMYAPGALEGAGINDTAAVVWAHAAVAEQVAK